MTSTRAASCTGCPKSHAVPNCACLLDLTARTRSENCGIHRRSAGARLAAHPRHSLGPCGNTADVGVGRLAAALVGPLPHTVLSALRHGLAHSAARLRSAAACWTWLFALGHYGPRSDRPPAPCGQRRRRYRGGSLSALAWAASGSRWRHRRRGSLIDVNRVVPIYGYRCAPADRAQCYGSGITGRHLVLKMLSLPVPVVTALLLRYGSVFARPGGVSSSVGWR